MISLVRAAHARDMYVMVDVVANHVGYIDTSKEGFSAIKPFDKEEYYHPDCEIKDWNDDQQMHNCRLAGLPDLDESNDQVRSLLKIWIKWLVYTYEFDGVRIDTLGHMPNDFWKEF